jgi:hypothetical protein
MCWLQELWNRDYCFGLKINQCSENSGRIFKYCISGFMLLTSLISKYWPQSTILSSFQSRTFETLSVPFNHDNNLNNDIFINFTTLSCNSLFCATLNQMQMLAHNKYFVKIFIFIEDISDTKPQLAVTLPPHFPLMDVP